MKRSIHRSASAAVALLALTLMGCQFRQMLIYIPDFESNVIEGIQLWRGDEPASEIVSDAGRITFGDCFFGQGAEVIGYTMVDSQNQPYDFTFDVTVVRSADGDGVTLRLAFPGWREPPGWVRASTFNAAGESELSADAIFL
jgi:hypothetical protein